MQTSVRPADVLLFHCSYCQTELSVPLILQGVTGPCPCCAQSIQAPQVPPALQAAPLPFSLSLSLPPLDGAHEALTAPVPLPVWMQDPAAHPATQPVAPVLLRPTVEDGLLPRQLTEHESLRFQARLSIPQSEEPPDDNWRERHLDDRRRQGTMKRLDRAAEQFMNSKLWQVTRAGLLLTTGGLCAALALYLQDRNWVWELPWRPSPISNIAELPAAPLPVLSRAGETGEPFIMEDPSDMETPGRPPALLPIPDAVSLPVSASPIASGK